MSSRSTLFTPVEFAKLFAIDKQTLIYYDNQNIFCPQDKDEKGYRYYSAEQAFFFSVLLSLRCLEIPGAQLSEYNKDQSASKLIELLNDKILEYDSRSEYLNITVKNLNAMTALIKDTVQFPLNKIMLIPQGNIYCQRGQCVVANTEKKKALLQNAPIIKEYAQNLFQKQFQLSIMPQYKALSDLKSPYAYYLVLTTKQKGILQNPLVYPPGIYLTLVTTGASTFKALKNNLSLIQDFATKVNLHCKTTTFITPLRSFQLDAQKKESYTKIEILVDYVDSAN